VRNCFGDSSVEEVSNSSPILSDEKCDCTIDCNFFVPSMIPKTSKIGATRCQLNFKAKMHQIRFRLGELTALPIP